jgi:hypothetical protein
MSVGPGGSFLTYALNTGIDFFKCITSVKREVEYMLYACSLTHLKLLFKPDRSISCGLHNVLIENVDYRFVRSPCS